jgi:hypothetical protein
MLKWLHALVEVILVLMIALNYRMVYTIFPSSTVTEIQLAKVPPLSTPKRHRVVQASRLSLYLK